MSQPSKPFKDERVQHLCNEIRKFSYTSFLDSIEEYRIKVLDKLELDRSDTVVAWVLVMELNYACGMFAEYEPDFSRGTATPTESDVETLTKYITQRHKLPAKFSDAAIIFGTEPSNFQSKLSDFLNRLHKERLQDGEYKWLNDVTSSLAGSLLVYSMPIFEGKKLPTTAELLEKASQTQYHLGFFELRTLQQLVKSKLEELGNKPFVFLKDEAMWRLAKNFILDDDVLRSRTLEELLVFQPTFFLNREGEFRLHVFLRPIVFVHGMANLELLDVAKKYSNVEGASFEGFINDFLTKNVGRFEAETFDLKIHKIDSQGFSFHPNLIIQSRDVPELFSKLPKPKPSIEIDGVANHESGYSVILESKYCEHPKSSRRYYLYGKGDSWAIQPTLKAILEFLKARPDKKALFNIPTENKVYGAYVTNKHGPYFAIQDNILKVSPLEVALEGKFHSLFDNLS